MQKKVTRLAWAALAALLLAAGLAAARPAPARADEAMLWRAVSPEGRELYLLGSVHMARTSFYPLKPVINEAFDRSGTLVLELDPESEDIQGTLTIMLDKGTYDPPDNLMLHLDPELRVLLEAQAENLPGGVECPFKPWLAAVTLSVTILERLGYIVKEGVDRHFLAKARERGMPFVELETAEEQLGVFADMSEQESMLFLKATLLELKDVETFMDELVGAWIAGDEAKFEEAFFSTYVAWPDLAPLLDRVVFDRNQTMYRRLLPHLNGAGPPVFAVIGSGHLVGSRGIPALFAGAGWRLEKF
ncbi:MAG: TraB/GumN family protein [Deltaproteobacteria bacterium]|nr:TraB/GumN family protein [Deltaproteobacteria bacterium]